MVLLAGVTTMASNLLRNLVSASCLPVRRSLLLRSLTGTSETAGRCEAQARSTAEVLPTEHKDKESKKRRKKNRKSQLQRRDDGTGALSTDRNNQPRGFDLDLVDFILPARRLRTMMETMDRIFEDPFFVPPAFRDASSRRALRTPFDFKETNDAFKVRLDVPGFSKDEVKIFVDEDSLVIKGEKKVEDGYGSYYTRIVLPDDVSRRRSEQN